MRILQVLLSPRIGGAESVADSLAAEWSRLGAEVSTAYLDGATEGSRLRRVRGLRSTIRSFGPDVLVPHSALPIAYSRLVSPWSLPLVPVLHSSGDDYSAPLLRVVEKLFMFRSPIIIAVSDAAAAVHRRAFGPAQLIRVIPNGIRPVDAPAARGRRPLTVGTLARVSEVKNPLLWTRVASDERLQGLEFIWFGPVEDGEVRNFVERHRARSQPGTFFGPADPVHALQNVDILFHPSDREAQALAILEALTAGLPVVCSDPVALVLEPGLVSATFVAGDAESAVKALQSAIENYEEEQLAAVRRRRLVLDKHRIDQCAAAYLDVFTEVCTTSPA